MKKISLLLLLVVSFSLVLSGCIVTDNGNDYERKEFKSKETISKVVVSAESADVLFQISDNIQSRQLNKCTIFLLQMEY